MNQNKIENICNVCKKPIDLAKDDFVVGVAGKKREFFHLACMKNYEKEEVKEDIIEQVEDTYDINNDSAEDDDSDDDLDDDYDLDDD